MRSGLLQTPPDPGKNPPNSAITPVSTSASARARRWGWDQLDKDEDDLVTLDSRPAVFRVMSAYGDHAHRGCNIVALIRERARGGELSEEDIRAILEVRPRAAIRAAARCKCPATFRVTARGSPRPLVTADLPHFSGQQRAGDSDRCRRRGSGAARASARLRPSPGTLGRRLCGFSPGP